MTKVITQQQALVLRGLREALGWPGTEADAGSSVEPSCRARKGCGFASTHIPHLRTSCERPLEPSVASMLANGWENRDIRRLEANRLRRDRWQRNCLQ